MVNVSITLCPKCERLVRLSDTRGVLIWGIKDWCHRFHSHGGVKLTPRKEE